MVQAFLGRFVDVTKRLGGDMTVKVKAVGAGHFFLQFGDFPFVGGQSRFFVAQVPFGLGQVRRNAVVVGEKSLQFFVKDYLCDIAR